MSMTKSPHQTRIRRSVAKALLSVSEGTFVGVTFRKADGSLRDLNGRLGVRKGTKGGKSNLDPNKHLCIYDVKNEGFRAVSLSTLTSLRMRGFKYELEEAEVMA